MHKMSENKTNSIIAELAKEIGDAAQEIDSQLIPTLVLHASPQTLGIAEVVGYRFYPDARGSVEPNVPPVSAVPLRRSAPLPKADTPLLSKENSNTALIAEYKPTDGPANTMDDERKLIGAATALMYNDPRRRHLMGFTIEDDQMRMWYFCRGHVCVSVAFNFQTTELGYDPSIDRLTIKNDDGKDVIAYQYKVDDTYYLTQGHPLSEDAAYRMKVRMMIMGAEGWTKKLEDKECVLKDVWLYENTLLEHEIKEAIFDALKNKDDTEKTTHATDAEPYFMTYAHDWKVESEHLPSGDCTPSLPEGWKPAQFSRQCQGLATPESSAQRTPSVDTLDVSAPIAGSLQHHARIHVRTVTKEVCQTLDEMTDYKTVLEYIIQIVQVLRYMYLAGFVHRDISPGNCLWHAPMGQAKISDLEYARSFSELSGHDPRTGTPSFMAAEYQSQEHLFKEIPFVRKRNRIPSPTFFTFNFYHDLESVFWLYAWFLHQCPPARLTLSDEEKKLLLKSHADYIHCGIGGTALRNGLVLKGDGVTRLVDQLATVYRDIDFLLDGLGSLEILRAAYKLLEATEPRRDKEGNPLHWEETNFQPQVYDKFRQCFQVIRGDLSKLEDTVPVQRLVPPSVKRIADMQADPTIKPTNAKRAKKSQ
ncbi:hypothetical protein C8R47DRAFT_1289190 [Mycena vitilis]|nr:hypothetical protein C8R47DRAFT_1289190 [Mycena vitilis]